jgi:hypothetical protein
VSHPSQLLSARWQILLKVLTAATKRSPGQKLLHKVTTFAAQTPVWIDKVSIPDRLHPWTAAFFLRN